MGVTACHWRLLRPTSIWHLKWTWEDASDVKKVEGPAYPVDGPRRHRRPLRFGDRQRLPSEHGLVHRTAPADHSPLQTPNAEPGITIGHVA